MARLHVGNLDFDVTEEGLRKTFEAYGTVNTVQIKIDRETGRSRGIAAVEMSTAEEGDKAVAGAHGAMVGTRPITVVAQSISERLHGGGGFAGRK